MVDDYFDSFISELRDNKAAEEFINAHKVLGTTTLGEEKIHLLREILYTKSLNMVIRNKQELYRQYSLVCSLPEQEFYRAVADLENKIGYQNLSDEEKKVIKAETLKEFEERERQIAISDSVFVNINQYLSELNNESISTDKINKLIEHVSEQYKNFFDQIRMVNINPANPTRFLPYTTAKDYADGLRYLKSWCQTYLFENYQISLEFPDWIFSERLEEDSTYCQFRIQHYLIALPLDFKNPA